MISIIDTRQTYSDEEKSSIIMTGIRGKESIVFLCRVEEVTQSHFFRSGEELEKTLHRYVWLYNHQVPQSALGSKTPLQAMKQWHKLKSELFKKQPYYLTGCDT